MSRRLLPVFAVGRDRYDRNSPPQRLPFDAWSAPDGQHGSVVYLHDSGKAACEVARLCGFTVTMHTIEVPRYGGPSYELVPCYETPSHEYAVAWIVFVEGETPRPLAPEFRAAEAEPCDCAKGERT